jgi:hypothetical protein
MARRLKLAISFALIEQHITKGVTLIHIEGRKAWV